MEDKWGPTHEVQLESGTAAKARLHTVIQYDQEWPKTGVKPHLPTTTSTSALPESGGEADQRLNETKYDWTLRKPTETITDKGGLEVKSRTAYNFASGLPTEISLPAKPEGGDAHTTKIIYYSLTSCSAAKPGYYGLPCKVKPATQPGTEGQPELLVKRSLPTRRSGHRPK